MVLMNIYRIRGTLYDISGFKSYPCWYALSWFSLEAANS